MLKRMIDIPPTCTPLCSSLEVFSGHSSSIRGENQRILKVPNLDTNLARD